MEEISGEMEQIVLEKVCRVCLNDCNAEFFDLNDVAWHERTYKNIIKSLTKFSVKDQDPVLICKHCAAHLIESLKLKITLEETQILLDQIYQQQKEEVTEIKTETFYKDIEVKIIGDEKCQKSFSTNEYQEIHKKNIFEKFPTTTTESHPRLTGPFQCELCKKSLKNKECLANHIQAVHLNKTFQCKLCPNLYKSRSGHDQHMAVAHKKNKSFHCSICSYKTFSKTLMKKHESRHTNNQKHFCTQCNQSFVSTDNLRRHVNAVHNATREFMCEICKRTFKTKEAMRKHQAIHQSYRYKCPKCTKKYLTNQAMRKHCVKVHLDYELPPLGTILAENAKVMTNTKIIAKLQKIDFPEVEANIMIEPIEYETDIIYEDKIFEF